MSKSRNVPKDTQPFPFLYMFDFYCESNGLLNSKISNRKFISFFYIQTTTTSTSSSFTKKNTCFPKEPSSFDTPGETFDNFPGETQVSEKEQLSPERWSDGIDGTDLIVAVGHELCLKKATIRVSKNRTQVKCFYTYAIYIYIYTRVYIYMYVNLHVVCFFD